MPSTAMRSPGLTRIVSPFCTAVIGTVRSSESTIIVTVLGCSPINFFMAVEVFCLARSSSNRPNRMNAMITLAASK